MLGIVICATIVLVGFVAIVTLGQNITEKAIEYFKEKF